MKLLEGLEPADVAAHVDAGPTAIRAVKKAAKMLSAGQYCVIIGVGGLGHIGLQCHKALSSGTVIAVDMPSRPSTSLKNGAQTTPFSLTADRSKRSRS